MIFSFFSFFFFSPYSCQLIPLICVVLFKTGDTSQEIREKAAQLICILDRLKISFINYFFLTRLFLFLL